MTSNKVATPKIDIYSAFLNDLASGQIQPNQRVGEETLALRWNVSRLPVRDALIRLEAEGVVERVPSSGTYVKQINLKELEEIWALRSAIETCVFRKATEVATDSQLDELDEVAKWLDENDPSQVSTEQIVEHEMKFHLGLCDYADMQHASRMLRIQHLLLRSLRYILQFQYDSIDVGKPFYRHGDLVKALRSRNPELSEAAIKQHYNLSLGEIKRAFERMQEQSAAECDIVSASSRKIRSVKKKSKKDV